MASLKLKVSGGVFCILSVLAPHNLKEIQDKLAFHEDLSMLLNKCCTNGPRFIFGDFNARLGDRREGEHDIMFYCDDKTCELITPRLRWGCSARYVCTGLARRGCWSGVRGASYT